MLCSVNTPCALTIPCGMDYCYYQNTILGAIHLLCILLVLLALMPLDVLGSKHVHTCAGVQRAIFVYRISHTVLLMLMVVEVTHVIQHIAYAAAAALHIMALLDV